MPQSPQSRPLDALAIAVTVGLCLTWGFNQVAIKLAMHDIPLKTSKSYGHIDKNVQRLIGGKLSFGLTEMLT